MTKGLSQFLRQVFRGFGAPWNEEGFSRLSRHEPTRRTTYRPVTPGSAYPSGRSYLRPVGPDPSLAPIKLPESRRPSLRGQMTWPSPSQQTLGGLACEVSLLMDSHAKNTVGLLSESWRTALLRRALWKGLSQNSHGPMARKLWHVTSSFEADGTRLSNRRAEV
jgi:hypothetical protein